MLNSAALTILAGWFSLVASSELQSSYSEHRATVDVDLRCFTACCWNSVTRSGSDADNVWPSFGTLPRVSPGNNVV